MLAFEKPMAQDPTLRSLFEEMTSAWGEDPEDAADSADEDGAATSADPYDEEPAPTAPTPVESPAGENNSPPTLESLMWQLQILQRLVWHILGPAELDIEIVILKSCSVAFNPRIPPGMHSKITELLGGLLLRPVSPQAGPVLCARRHFETTYLFM